VVVPLFADQFENGRRVAAAGAGMIVEPEPGGDPGARTVITRSDAPRITDAISQVLNDASYQHTADAMAADMAATPTADEVLAALLER
jgi:UDP:flavonoid glycosyltransferase YjiC (YdhE family)